MICQRCAKERDGIHICTPSPLVRELEQQRDNYKDVAEAHSSAFQECIRLREELAEVKQQRDEYKKDAERYRWLRDCSGGPPGAITVRGEWNAYLGDFVHVRAKELDAAIDAAIPKVKP